MKFYLIVAKGKHKGMPIPITVDLFFLGSDKVCQLRSALPGVGGQHCALVTRERKVFVRDMDSGEPTLVNGEPLPPGEEWPLHPGDRLGVGPLEFMLQFREKPLSQRDLEEWALRSLDLDASREIADLDEMSSVTRQKSSTAANAAEAILGRMAARRGLVMGRLRIGNENGVMIVRFNDAYLVEEAEIGLVRKELYDNLTKPNLRILLDFKNVKRMSSMAAKMIDDVYTWLRPRGGTMAMCRIRSELQEITSTLGLKNQIPVFSGKKEALAERW